MDKIPAIDKLEAQAERDMEHYLARLVEYEVSFFAVPENTGLFRYPGTLEEAKEKFLEELTKVYGDKFELNYFRVLETQLDLPLEDVKEEIEVKKEKLN